MTLFEQQAAHTPDAIAVVYADATLSYSEVNRRANVLAHYLRKQGAGPTTLVGLCVERSLDMLVASARYPQKRRRLRSRSTHPIPESDWLSCSATRMPCSC